MKALRLAALGLVAALCLLAVAPAAVADDNWTPRAIAGGPGGWVADWLAWLASFFEPAPGGPRAVTAQTGSCIDPGGSPAPCPTGEAPTLPGADGDTGSCIDPGGTPVSCRP